MRLTPAQPSRALSADSSRSFESHDQPSPIFSQSMPPRAAAALASPTFHLPDLTNWKTPQRYPRAHERMSIPNAEVDLPLPVPVTTTTSGLSRGLRRLGSALPVSPGRCGTSTSSPP